MDVRLDPEVDAGELPAQLAGYDFILDDHSYLPTEAIAGCPHLKDVIFLGTGARSYMDPDELPVRGPLAVFGERPGGWAGCPERIARRAPYLAACVVGRSDEAGPVEVLSAYVHPCVGKRHLMLVDSDLERRTLAQLYSLQGWLGDKKALPRVDREADL